MEKYQLLFESVFKKDPAAADTVSFLEKITEAYPYFSTAQFYLLLSLKKDTPAYKKQVKKTAAIFNNNYWLNFLLLEAGHQHASIVDQQKFSLEEKDMAADNNPIIAEENFAAMGTWEAPQVTEPIDESSAIEAVVAAINDTTPAKEEQEVTDHSEIVSALKEQLPAKGDTNLTENKFSQAIEPEAAVLDTDKEITGQAAIESNLTEEQPEITVTETTEEKKEEEVDLKEMTPEKDEPEKEPEIPQIKISIDPSAIAIAADAPLFEPLHTTDYFASVGIKLSEDAKSADKLGKQLKSFTEWLKTMKKVHAEQIMKTSTASEIEADNTESNIQQLAEKSNLDDEVVTEAMADVLVQQGRKSKAIEVLGKLSLLDPGKSAYFAAKINQIKES